MEIQFKLKSYMCANVNSHNQILSLIFKCLKNLQYNPALKLSREEKNIKNIFHFEYSSPYPFQNINNMIWGILNHFYSSFSIILRCIMLYIEVSNALIKVKVYYYNNWLIGSNYHLSHMLLTSLRWCRKYILTDWQMATFDISSENMFSVLFMRYVYKFI